MLGDPLMEGKVGVWCITMKYLSSCLLGGESWSVEAWWEVGAQAGCVFGPG